MRKTGQSPKPEAPSLASVFQCFSSGFTAASTVCFDRRGRRGMVDRERLVIGIVYYRALYGKKQNGVKTGYQKKECHENATFFSGKIKKNKYKRGISTTLVVQHREKLSVVSYHVYLKIM